MLILPQLFGFSEDYYAIGANFNGSYLQRGGNLTGLADTKELLISFWFNPAVLSGGSTYTLMATNQPRFTVTLDGSSQKLTVFGLSTDGTTALSVTTAAMFSVSTWYHFLISCDLTNASKRAIYINNSADSAVWGVYGNKVIDYTDTEFSICANVAAGNKYFGDIADVALDNAYQDISDADIRGKFISSAGKPVSLGISGQSAFGYLPPLFLSLAPNEAANDFSVNKGGGGGMTRFGTLSYSVNSPSD